MKDAEGNVTEVRCTVDLDSFSGSAGADRKIKGKTLHWVPVNDCVPFEARLYEPLLNDDGTQYGVYDWTRDLAKNLRKNLGLKVSNKAQGLGEVLLVIENQ